MTPDTMRLTSEEAALLRRLMDEFGFMHARAQDLGGYDVRQGSMVATRLARLAQRGHVRRMRTNSTARQRARYSYAITNQGARALVEHEAATALGRA